jgi:hypothetical protein
MVFLQLNRGQIIDSATVVHLVQGQAAGVPHRACHAVAPRQHFGRFKAPGGTRWQRSRRTEDFTGSHFGPLEHRSPAARAVNRPGTGLGSAMTAPAARPRSEFLRCRKSLSIRPR